MTLGIMLFIGLLSGVVGAIMQEAGIQAPVAYYWLGAGTAIVLAAVQSFCDEIREGSSHE